MTTTELLALPPGTLIYQAKGSYYRTYALVGPTPGCNGSFIFQSVRGDVRLPSVRSRNAAEYMTYTVDKQAVLVEVEPVMARKLAKVRGEMEVQ